jgi:uncharacterized protein
MAETDDVFRRLQRAIKRSDFAALRIELDSGVSHNLANKFGWTLLMLAEFKGGVAIGELLISRGADMNKATNYGKSGFPEQTALSSAIIGGHPRFLKLLLDKGADINSTLTGASPENWLSVCHHNPTTTQALEMILRDFRAKISN